MAMGASAEPREASAGRCQAVPLPSSAAGRRASVRHRSDRGPRAGGGRARWRLPLAGVGLPHQQADRGERDGTAGMEQAEMPDFHEPIGQDMLKEPAEKFHDVKVCGTEASTAHLAVGEGDRAVPQADEPVVGDSDLEDIRSEVGESGVAVVLGLRVDVPGDGPDLGLDVLEQASVVHGVFEEGAVDGGEGFDRDKEVGAGGPPGCAVCGEATAGHNIMDVRVVLELPTPGMQDPGEPWEVRADEALVGGQPLESRGRRLQHRLGREALMGADEGSERLRDGEGEEEVRPGQLLLQGMLEPLLGCMLLTLGTVAVATGMMDALLSCTVWALRETRAIGAAAAVLDGADPLTV